MVPTTPEFRLHLLPMEEELKRYVSVDLRVKYVLYGGGLAVALCLMFMMTL
jgi:hypothetical protein